MNWIIFTMLTTFVISTGCTQPSVQVHGHRGCRGVMPENSIQGFIHALELGVDVLEMDVVINGDGNLIVSHEPWMNPDICRSKKLGVMECGEDHNIYTMTQEEIEEYDCGVIQHPEFPNQETILVRKPLLSEVVKAINMFQSEEEEKVLLSIQIKFEEVWVGVYCPDRVTFLDIFIKEVQDLGIEERMILQCLDPGILRLAHIRKVTFPMSLLVKNLKGIRRNIDQLGFVPSYYSPYFRFVNKRMMKKAHKLGIKVVPWTVNKEKHIRKMVKMGVDGIISDYPDRATHVIEKMKQ